MIPFYNGRDTIRRALDSLERQTLQPAEIVVVDDGSPLSPFEDRMVTPGIPIRVIRLPENQGIPAARNAGIRAAAQPWIAFLDQDDEWATDKLERQWRTLEREGLRHESVIFGRLLMETGRDRPYLRPPRSAIADVEAGDRRAVAAFVRHGNVLPLVTLLLSRELFERHGYLDETLRGGADDTEFVLRLIGEGAVFRFDGHGDSGVWSAAHRHTGQNYSSHAPRWVADQLEFVPRLAERYGCIVPFEDLLLARSRFTLGRHHERQGDAEAAAREYARASRLDPSWWRPWAARARIHVPRPLRRWTARAWAFLEDMVREHPAAENR